MDEGRTHSVAARVARGLIRVYQWVTVGIPHRCRFAPSCSEYVCEALMVHGFWNGLLVGCRRILKCHPWNPGGYDPIPSSPALVSGGSILTIRPHGSSVDGHGG